MLINCPGIVQKIVLLLFDLGKRKYCAMKKDKPLKIKNDLIVWLYSQPKYTYKYKYNGATFWLL